MNISKKIAASFIIFFFGILIYAIYISIPVATTPYYKMKVTSADLARLTAATSLKTVITGGKIALAPVVVVTPAYLVQLRTTVNLTGTLDPGTYIVSTRQITGLVAFNPSGYFELWATYYSVNRAKVSYEIHPFTSTGDPIDYTPTDPLFLLNPCPPADPY